MRFIFFRRIAAGMVICMALGVAACSGNTVTVVASGGDTSTPVATLPPPVAATPIPASPVPLPTTPPTPTPLPGPTPYTHLVYAQRTLTGGSDVGPVTATCPAGQIALGGGWATSGYGNVYNSSQSGNGWQVYVNNYGASDLVNAYVMCLVNQPGAVVTERLNQVSVPASSSSTDNLSYCQSNEILIGGGFALSSTIFLNSQEFNSTDKAWRGNFSNYGSTPALANVYAMCLRANYMFASPQGAAKVVVTSANGSSTATCPAGFMVTGGGYGISSAAVVFNSSPTANGWEAAISVLSLALPSTLIATAQCVKFS
jgi:hypothetical protein